MLRNEIFKRAFTLPFRAISRPNSSQINLEKLEQDSAIETVVEEDAAQREEEIQQKRNKSRLRTADRSILLDQNPYTEPQMWYHGTLKYVRRTYGRYGAESGVDPSVCWPTEKELALSKEYERVAFPYGVHEVVNEANQRRQEKEKAVRLRQEEIVKKIAKLEDMKRDLYNRIAKKEADAQAAKDRKQRLVEEVKAHFGYTVDPRDDKFKEMLEKKEKEQRKLMKEARKREKEEKLVLKMTKKKEKVSETEDKDD